MNSNSLTRQEALEVIYRGKFYYPAFKHHSQSPVNINCDLCRKSGLECSIGYQSYDLCLGCVDMLVGSGSKQNQITKLSQINQPNQFNSQNIQTQQSKQAKEFQQTQQAQPNFLQQNPSSNSSSNSSQYLTRMAQDSVRINQSGKNTSQIRPSNDFGTEGSSWGDMFNSSLNPSGMSNYRPGQYQSVNNNFNSVADSDPDPNTNPDQYVTFMMQDSVRTNNQQPNRTVEQNLSREHFGSATNNPSAFNNSAQSDYLETFYQPITPGGLPKRR